MSSSPGTREEETSPREVEASGSSGRRNKRNASVFDAVAGSVGFNGFLSKSQHDAGVAALTPEEVLLRRVDAPIGVTKDYYNADELLNPHQKLPDTELSKALHLYASEFYTANTHAYVDQNFRSLDETALIAFAILLEEVSAEAMGENGDMVLVEPEGLEHGLPETALIKHQVRGKVKPPPTPEAAHSAEASSSDELASEDGRNRKRRRR